MSFIYKYETLHCFIKGVNGGCFVFIKNDNPQSAFTHNPGPTIFLGNDCGSVCRAVGRGSNPVIGEF